MNKRFLGFKLRKYLLLVAVVMALALVGCGKGEQGVSEHDAADLPESSSEQNLTENINQEEAEVSPTVISNVKAGDIIKFGTYPQSSGSANPEPIEWLVLDVSGGKALLLSVYCLDCMPYNEEWCETSWEKCSLREWLNSEFYDSAFSDEDKRIIPRTHLSNERNSEYGTSGGNDTDDYVFLLSWSDAVKYLDINAHEVSGQRPYDNPYVGSPATPYAISRGLENHDNIMFLQDGHDTTCSWWLRTVGQTEKRAIDFCVSYISESGGSVEDDQHGVRPMVYVSLDGVIANN